MATLRPARILVVEDETLIADLLERHLQQAGYEVLGPAADLEEVRDLLAYHEGIDLALLDIRLSVPPDGIEVARWMRSHHPGVRVLFVTSQFDDQYLQRATALSPDGYLTKPVQRETLLATVAVALARDSATSDVVELDEEFDAGSKRQRISIRDGHETVIIELDELVFVRSDHVYVEYVLASGRRYLVRATLQSVIALLPQPRFVQVHRSSLVNLDYVGRVRYQSVLLTTGQELRVSRTRRAALMARLTNEDAEASQQGPGSA